MRFSQRHGYTEVRNVIQRESLDDRLRKALWNVIYTAIIKPDKDDLDRSGRSHSSVTRFYLNIWTAEWGHALDEYPGSRNFHDLLRNHVMTRYWYEVYDLIEILYDFYPDVYVLPSRDVFAEGINKMLKANTAAYRLVDGKIVEVTSDEQIVSIEEAIDQSEFSGAAEHLRTALGYLAEREKPQYRNSIKESISAVESVIKQATGEKDFLKAMTKLEREHKIHGALKSGFTKLYAYSSDEGGIRHAMLEEPDLDVEDAMFMLVTCSAFVNYLRAKGQKAPPEE